VVDAFFAAARGGDFEALVAVLDPDVVLRSDGGPGRPRFSALIHGAHEVASQAIRFALPTALLRPALINGAAGVVVMVNGRPFSVIGFTVRGGKVVEIDAIADPERLRQLDLAVLDD
jgi:RNA polymerase sigma-70 factor (ECF subfamily)